MWLAGTGRKQGAYSMFLRKHASQDLHWNTISSARAHKRVCEHRVTQRGPTPRRRITGLTGSLHGVPSFATPFLALLVAVHAIIEPQATRKANGHLCVQYVLAHGAW